VRRDRYSLLCIVVLAWPAIALAAEPFAFVAAKKYKGESVNLAKSADGKLTFAPQGYYGDIMDVKTKEGLHTIETGLMWTSAKTTSNSVDGLETNTGELRVWDVRTGKLVQQFSRQIGSIRAVAISADGAKLIFDAVAYSIDGP